MGVRAGAAWENEQTQAAVLCGVHCHAEEPPRYHTLTPRSRDYTTRSVLR